MNVYRQIIEHCFQNPNSTAFEVLSESMTPRRAVTYADMLKGVANVTRLLDAFDGGESGTRYGLVMLNSPEWVVSDLALGLSSRVEVPVPTIFNAEQAKNLIRGVKACLVDDHGYEALSKWEKQWGLERPVEKIRIDQATLYKGVEEAEWTAYNRRWDNLPETEFICKTIHTSGTTNAPKGVNISQGALSAQIAALRSRLGERTFSRYLSIVPMSLLIEQITAIYLFMSYGGTLSFLSPQTPLLGSSEARPKDFIRYFPVVKPDFVVVSPSIVEAIHSLVSGPTFTRSESASEKIFGQSTAPFIACGNAPISPEILKELDSVGLPIMEGYGLSENTSVVTWNSLSEYRYGTVGRPLRHVQLKVDDSGELLVKSDSLFKGYTTEDPSSCVIDDEGWLHTGDIAQIDADGYVTIKGRKKHVLITANGRNVSPEWVETQYKRLPFIRNVVVYGDGLPQLMAAIVTDRTDKTEEELRAEIDRFSQNNCSEIERIYDYVLLEESEELYKQYFTITGDPKRKKLWELVGQRSDSVAAATV